MAPATKTAVINRVLKNWKTTAIAVAGIVTMVVADMKTDHISTPQWVLTLALICKAVTLTLSKDK